MAPEESRKMIPRGGELVSSFQILSLVGEALERICEGSESGTVRQSVKRIGDRFCECEGILDGLAGGSLSHGEQVAEIGRLRDELERKRGMVRKYAGHDVFGGVVVGRKGEMETDGEGDKVGGGVMEDDAERIKEVDKGVGEAGAEDVMMKMEEEVFGEVGEMEKEVGEDVLMGLDI